jgi:hypothetical protein
VELLAMFASVAKSGMLLNFGKPVNEFNLLNNPAGVFEK